MSLRLDERVRRRGDDRTLWYPFHDANGFNAQWWLNHAFDHHRYFSILDGDNEVARVDLDDRVWVDEYPGAPTGPDLLEVQFLEVRDGCRLKGLGTDIVSMMVNANPGRRLVAFPSGEAASFWEGHLRWDRYDDPYNRLRAPLLVCPTIG